MQIASTTTPAPAAVDAAGSARFRQRYAEALTSLPGVTGITWRPAVGDEVTVLYRSEAMRQVGEMVLEDVVDGVRILTALAGWVGGPTEPDRGLWKHQEAIAAVAALPGVWNTTVHSGGWPSPANVIVHAVDQRAVDLLDPLVRDVIDGPLLDDGTARPYRVTWSAGVR